MELVPLNPPKKTNRMIWVMLGISLVLFLLAVFVAPHADSLPGQPAPVKLQWGTNASSADHALLDSGVQQALPEQTNATTVSGQCNVYDAGLNAAVGDVCLLGSDDQKFWFVLGACQVLPGVSGSVAFDPVTTGFQWLTFSVDAGGTVAGQVDCRINGKGGAL